MSTAEPLPCFAYLHDLSNAMDGDDWREILGCPHVAPSVLQHRLPISSAPNKFSKLWGVTDVTVGALAMACSHYHRSSTKDSLAVVLGTFNGTERKVDEQRSSTGLTLDDDGVIGRRRLLAGLEASGILAFLYSTASDGQYTERVETSAYAKQAARERWPATPTDASMGAFLNLKHVDGAAFRNVRLLPTVEVTETKDAATIYYVVEFDPQERTRTVIPYARPIDGDLFARLQALDAYEDYARAAELHILRASGCDASCLNRALSVG